MKHFSIMIALILALLLSAACGTAKKTGTAVKEGTTAAGKEVADKTEDAAEKTADAGKAVAAKADDASTTAAIKMKFANDKTVDAWDINVDTKDGHVTLTGTVNSNAEYNKAIAIAKSVEGVKSVTPKLATKAK